MQYVSFVIVGLIATAYMTAVNLGAERLRLVRGTMLQAIGAFVIPEPLRSFSLQMLLHFVAGIAFTGVYAYIFNFLTPASIPDFVSVGVLIGLVHGFFVSFFLMLGFSGLEGAKPDKPFTLPAAILNIGAHVVFGLMTGLGLGAARLTGTVLWYAAYSVAGLLAAGGIAVLLTPQIRRFQPRNQPATERGL